MEELNSCYKDCGAYKACIYYLALYTQKKCEEPSLK